MVVVVVVAGTVVVVVAGTVVVVVAATVVVVVAATVVVVVAATVVVVVAGTVVVVVAGRVVVVVAGRVVLTGRAIVMTWCQERWLGGVAAEVPLTAKELTSAASATATTIPPARVRCRRIGEAL
jgi:hypothetical protein